MKRLAFMRYTEDFENLRRYFSEVVSAGMTPSFVFFSSVAVEEAKDQLERVFRAWFESAASAEISPSIMIVSDSSDGDVERLIRRLSFSGITTATVVLPSDKLNLSAFDCLINYAEGNVVAVFYAD